MPGNPGSNRFHNLLIACLILSLLGALASAVVYVAVNNRHLSFEVNSSRSAMGQLFFDTGKGFNEIESAKFQISETNTWKRIEIGLPSVSVVRIRLDPDVASGTYLFRDFQVANVLGFSKTRLDLNALVLNGSTSATTEQIKSASIDGDVLRLETTEAANDPQVVLFKVSSQDQTMRGHLLLGLF